MTDINLFLTNIIEEQERLYANADYKAAGEATRATESLGDAQVAEEGRNSLNPLTIPSLLTRAKLSPMTRRMEERRLMVIQKKKERLASKEAGNRSKGRRHWKRKEKTKRNRDRAVYEKAAGFGAILSARGAKRICPVLWEKYIGECFREYTPEYLYVKRIKRAPGFGKDAYYGNWEFPYTVYSFRVHHKLLGIVWDGEEQRQLDGVDVLRITDNKKASSEAG